MGLLFVSSPFFFLAFFLRLTLPSSPAPEKEKKKAKKRAPQKSTFLAHDKFRKTQKNLIFDSLLCVYYLCALRFIIIDYFFTAFYFLKRRQYSHRPHEMINSFVVFLFKSNNTSNMIFGYSFFFFFLN